MFLAMQPLRAAAQRAATKSAAAAFKTMFYGPLIKGSEPMASLWAAAGDTSCFTYGFCFTHASSAVKQCYSRTRVHALSRVP